MTLTLSNLVKNDVNKQFTCTATEYVTDGYTSTRSDSVTLDIHYGPENVAFNPSTTIYEKEKNTNFDAVTCTASCNPPCSFRWNKVGQTVSISNNAVLNLEVLSSSEAGVYRCTAIRSSGATGTKDLTVNFIYGPYTQTTVITPPAQEYIRNEDGNIVPDIKCFADCYPNCTYTWTKVRQKETTTVSMSDLLSLGSLKRHDAANYSCTATNPGKSQSPTTTKQVAVRVRYGPYKANVNVQSPYYILEGDTNINIECSSDCYPGCSYSWTNLTSGIRISANGVLSLGTVNRYMAGDYKCVSSNTAVQLTKSSETTITVIVKERTVVKSFYIGERDDQTNVTVDEHDAAQFTCVVGGDPSSYVKITFEGEILIAQANTNELIFTRQDVACVYSGLYTCEGNDSYGRVSSKNATLLVKCSPRPLRQILGNITSPLYVPVTLTFIALAYPEPGPKGFSWYKEDNIGWMPLLGNKDLHVSSSGLQTSLTIMNVSRAHFGRYRVTVVNGIGTYDQYLFLSEEGEPFVCTESSKDDNEPTTVVIVSITLGIMCVVVTTYATGITILYKQNMIRKGSKSRYTPTSQTTYVNATFQSDATKVQEGGHRREHTDNVTGIDEESLKQYTDLAQLSRDEKTYDVIQ